MLRLLLLSAILAAPAAAAVNEPVPASGAILSANSVQANSSNKTDALGDSAQAVSNQQSLDSLEARPSSEICYKIRAYIFKRDDDHAPEYVGSTTCGPKAPRAKSVDGVKPRLIPAN